MEEMKLGDEKIPIEPIPLSILKLEDHCPYPFDYLPEEILEVINCLHEHVQCPKELCAQSIISAIALATSHIADISIDGRVYPLNQFFLSLAKSGERKSAVDRLALYPIIQFQNDKMIQYDSEYRDYKLQLEVVDNKKRKLLAQMSDDLALTKSILAELDMSLQKPLRPEILLKDITYEGLLRALNEGVAICGLFSSEAGSLLGGHAMSKENLLKTLCGLSELWDCSPVSRIRADRDNSYTVKNKRFTMNLMIQPEVARDLVENTTFINQGFLPRCLISHPRSTAGTRVYKEGDPKLSPAYKKYYSSIQRALSVGLSKACRGEVKTSLLTLSNEAYGTFIDVYHRFEALFQYPEYDGLSGFISKSAENSLRLAGVFACYRSPENPDVGPDLILAGEKIAEYHLDQAKQLITIMSQSNSLWAAEKLLETIERNGWSNFTTSQAAQVAPSKYRQVDKTRTLLKILVEHGYLRKMDEGALVNGKSVKEAWETTQQDEKKKGE